MSIFCPSYGQRQYPTFTGNELRSRKILKQAHGRADTGITGAEKLAIASYDVQSWTSKARKSVIWAGS